MHLFIAKQTCDLYKLFSVQFLLNIQHVMPSRGTVLKIQYVRIDAVHSCIHVLDVQVSDKFSGIYLVFYLLKVIYV